MHEKDGITVVWMGDGYLDTFSCSNPKLPIPLSHATEPEQGITGEPPPLIPTACGGALFPVPSSFSSSSSKFSSVSCLHG